MPANERLHRYQQPSTVSGEAQWWLATDTTGVPIGWIRAAANNNDCTLVAATLDAMDDRGLLEEVETLHLDRGYDYACVRSDCAGRGITDMIIPNVRPPKASGRRAKKPVPLGLRWPVERANSWLSTSGSYATTPTDAPRHRHAQLCLAIAILVNAKLIDWRDR